MNKFELKLNFVQAARFLAEGRTWKEELRNDQFIEDVGTQATAFWDNSDRAVERNIGEPGGVAFLWTTELGDVLNEFDTLSLTSWHAALTKALQKLLKFWVNLRKHRIPLDDSEFRVICAVKKGFKTSAAIAQITHLSPVVVKQALDRLKTMKYRDEFVLITEKDGVWETAF
jgi:hypothetical protein